MEDFNWEDFENNDDDLFGKKDENKEDVFRKMNRLMFIDDIERFQNRVVPLGPEEFKELFGNFQDEDMSIMTKVFIKDYWRELDCIDKWGVEWIWEILQYNVRIENYELCAIIRDYIKDNESQHLNKYFGINESEWNVTRG